MAALLAFGGDVALARGSAARLHGLSLGSGDPVAVLVRTRTFRGLDDIRIHRTRVLEADDVTTLGPLTVTTVARTLCDLAGHVSDDDLRKAVAMAVRRRWTDATQLRVMAGRLGRFRGRRRLVALLDEHCTPSMATADPRSRRGSSGSWSGPSAAHRDEPPGRRVVHQPDRVVGSVRQALDAADTDRECC